jgi:nicotinamide N-methyltransferase
MMASGLIRPSQIELRETEQAQQEAMLELQRMRETMERMEEERAEMVAEVEAQIERALASMAVDIDDSDYGSSRPDSRLSNISGTRSRRPSDAAKTRHLRSFGTESTLAESYGEDIEAVEQEGLPAHDKVERQTDTIVEDDEEEPVARTKRFSASEVDAPQDGMTAVDEGISQKSDKIAQKVLEIQQKVSLAPPTYLSNLSKTIRKLESALASDRRIAKRRPRSSKGSGEDELSEASTYSRRSRSKPRHSEQQYTKPISRPRTRSGTVSSTQANSSNIKSEDNRQPMPIQQKPSKIFSVDKEQTPTRASFLDVSGDDQSTPTSPLTATDISEHDVAPRTQHPVPVGLTDDSDTDFQSAYSTSPRGSYGSFDGQHAAIILPNTKHESIEDRLSAHPKTRRERVSSTSTATRVA